MSKAFLSIVNKGYTWQAVLVGITNGAIKILKTDTDSSYESLISRHKNTPYIISLPSSEGFVLKLDFPFAGKKKIASVIKGELEGMLPLSLDSTQFDFMELNAQGNVLSIVCAKSTISQYSPDKYLKNITLNAFAALYCLQRFKAFKKKNYVFAFLEKNFLSLLAFASETLVAVRQLFTNNDKTIIEQALTDIFTMPNFHPEVCYIASDPHDLVDDLAANIEKVYLHSYIANADNSLLIAVGSALMLANNAKVPNLINPSKDSQSNLPDMLLYGFAGLTLLAVLALLYLQFEFYSYNQTSKYLSSEQQRVYKLAFAKSPAVKDVASALQSKINALEGTSTAEFTSSVTALAEISRLIGEQIDVRITDFYYNYGEVTFSGNTISYSAVENIKASLQKSTVFKSVEITDLDLVSANQVKFKIKVQT